MRTCSTPAAPRRPAPRSASSPARCPDGGLLISASRLVEFNVRAHDPARARACSGSTSRRRRRRSACSPARSRATRSTGAPTSRRGTATATPAASRRSSSTRCFELPDGPVTGWLHILSFTDRDAAAVALRREGRAAVPRVSERADALLRVVRAGAPPAALARDPRPVRAARLRGDAPADAGRARRPVLRGVPRALPRSRGARRRARRATCSRRGAGSATTAARSRCRPRRAVVAEHGWPDDLTALPGVGPVHRRRGRLVRLGRAARRRRRQRRAA